MQAVNNMNAKDGAGGDKDCIGRMDSRVGVDASSGGSGQKKKRPRRRRIRRRRRRKGKERGRRKGEELFKSGCSVLRFTNKE